MFIAIINNNITFYASVFKRFMIHIPISLRNINMGSKGCCGFINRYAIGVGVWRFVEGGEHGGAIQDGDSMSLPSFRSCNGGKTLRAAIIHYKATSAWL
jgi:hypothetical protein